MSFTSITCVCYYCVKFTPWSGLQIYREDPVIVAWNLINEPRCDALGCNKNIQAWVGEMAPYLKSLDPNHLITIGTSQCPSSSYVVYLMRALQYVQKPTGEGTVSGFHM